MKYFTFFLLLLTSQLLFSQSSKQTACTVDWTSVKDLNAARILDAVECNGEIFYAYFTAFVVSDEKFRIQSMDGKHKIDREDFISKKLKVAFEDLLAIDNQLYLIFSKNVAKEEKRYFYLQKLNPTDLSIIGEFQELFYIDMSTSTMMHHLQYLTSSDLTKHFISVGKKYNKDDEINHFKVVELNTTGDIISKNDLSIPATQENYLYQTCLVDDNGDIYLTTLTGLHQKAKKRRPLWIYHQFDPTGKKVNEYKIQSAGSIFVKDTQLMISDNTRKVYGFYDDVEKESKGLLYQDIDKHDKPQLTVLDADIMKNESAKKFKNQLNYQIEDVYECEDGVLVVAENNFMYSKQRSGGGPITSSDPNYKGLQPMAKGTTEIYYSYDIIVMKLDKEGQLQWTKKIPKVQAGIQYQAVVIQHVSFFEKDKLYIVYNDNYKNLKITDPTRIIQFNSKTPLTTMLVTVESKDGSYTKERLFGKNDRNYKAEIKRAIKYNNNQCIIFGQDDSARFARLKF